MRVFVWLLCIIAISGCQHKGDITGKLVDIPLSLPTRADIMDSDSCLQVFVIDREEVICRHYVFNSRQLKSGILSTELPLGRYKLAFIMNARTGKEIEGGINQTLKDIRLRLLEENGYHTNASPFLTALQSVYITDNTTVLAPVQFQSRAKTLQVHLSNIPQDASHLKLKLFPVPASIPFSGKPNTSRACILHPLPTLPTGEGHTELVTLTPESAIQLFIEYTRAGQTAHKRIPLNNLNDTDEPVQVIGDFPSLPDEEPDLENLPDNDNPCTGHGNGINLLTNGSFEQWSDTHKSPDGWYFYRDGKDSCAISITDHPVLDGQQSVRLEGKTYLYQDIEITPGQCYEIKMHVNAPDGDFSWKYYCYWRKNKSTALPKEYNTPIQADCYLKQTDGWINVFEGKNFKAPEQAKLLRVEIRTYGKSRVPGTGIYIDKFSVEAIE